MAKFATGSAAGYNTSGSGTKTGDIREWKARIRWKATAYQLVPIVRGSIGHGKKRKPRRVMVYAPFPECSAIGAGAAADESPKPVPPMFWENLAVGRKPGRDELADFLEAMGSSIESGASEGDALMISAGSARTPRMRGIIGALWVLNTNGVELSASMELFPEAFPKMICALVKASEVAGGKKAEVFTHTANRMAHDNKLAKKFMGAMIYPVFVVVLACVAAIVLNIKALPPMVESFQSMGAKLPAITQFFYNFSTFLKNNVFIIVPVVLLIGFLLVKYMGRIIRTPFMQTALVKAPYFGPVVQGMAMSRGLEALAMLKEAGANDQQVYAIAGEASGNLIYRRYFTAIHERISMGSSPEEAFLAERERIGKDGLRVANKIKIGAVSGEIEQIAKKLAQEFRDRTDQRLQVLPQLMEIPLLALCGSIVGSIIMAIFLPIPSLIIDVLNKQNQR